MRQPRPQGAFPWLKLKAREKRPGDEVASEGFKMFNEIKLLAVSLEPYGHAKEIFFVTATLEEV